MSDDSEWRYSVDDVEDLETGSSNPIATSIGVIGVAGFLLFALYGVTAQPAATTPTVDVVGTATGSQVTVETLPYRYTQLTINASNTTHTVRDEQTVTINGTHPANITITGSKHVYNGSYLVTMEQQIIYPDKDTAT